MTRIIKWKHRNGHAFKKFNLVVLLGINCEKLCRGLTALGNSDMLSKVPQRSRGNGSQIARSRLNLYNLAKIIVG